MIVTIVSHKSKSESDKRRVHDLCIFFENNRIPFRIVHSDQVKIPIMNLKVPRIFATDATSSITSPYQEVPL